MADCAALGRDGVIRYIFEVFVEMSLMIEYNARSSIVWISLPWVRQRSSKLWVAIFKALKLNRVARLTLI
jgi:hypothetical protein